MRKHRGTPEFTHFASIPFIRQQQRLQLSNLQTKIIDVFKTKKLQHTLKINNPNLFHLTLSMLTMPHTSTKKKTQQILQNRRQQFSQILKNTKLTTQKIHYFTFKNNRNKNNNMEKNINVIYLDIKRDNQFTKLSKLTDHLIRLFLKEQIIIQSELKDMYIQYDHNSNMFKNRDPHITLFRCQNLIENQTFMECFNQIEDLYSDRILECDYVDISTRFDYDQTKFYTPLFRIYLNNNKIGEFFKSEIKQKQQQKQKVPYKKQYKQKYEPKKQ